MTVLFLLSHDCHGLLIYSSDFNVYTDRARIRFNISSYREENKCSFKNALEEKSKNSARNKTLLSGRIAIFFNCSSIYLKVNFCNCMFADK